MFDHVTCELPMPDGRDVPRDGFQTKSLDKCLMDLFTITVERSADLSSTPLLSRVPHRGPHA